MLREGALVGMSKAACVLLCLMVANTLCAASEAEASIAYVQLRTADTLAWRTAPGSHVTVPIPYPQGATRATLTVTGWRYAVTYPNITAAEFAFDLPSADSFEHERLYDLVLTFDSGAPVSTSLAVIDGYDATGSGRTRCLTRTDPAWPQVSRMALVPVPQGMTSLRVNDLEVETSLGGEIGWQVLATKSGRTYELAYETLAGGGSAHVLGSSIGLYLFLR